MDCCQNWRAGAEACHAGKHTRLLEPSCARMSGRGPSPTHPCVRNTHGPPSGLPRLRALLKSTATHIHIYTQPHTHLVDAHPRLDTSVQQLPTRPIHLRSSSRAPAAPTHPAHKGTTLSAGWLALLPYCSLHTQEQVPPTPLAQPPPTQHHHLAACLCQLLLLELSHQSSGTEQSQQQQRCVNSPYLSACC